MSSGLSKEGGSLSDKTKALLRDFQTVSSKDLVSGVGGCQVVTLAHAEVGEQRVVSFYFRNRLRKKTVATAPLPMSGAIVIVEFTSRRECPRDGELTALVAPLPLRRRAPGLRIFLVAAALAAAVRSRKLAIFVPLLTFGGVPTSA